MDCSQHLKLKKHVLLTTVPYNWEWLKFSTIVPLSGRKYILFNFERIFSRIFIQNFMILALNSFLFVTRQLSNILYRQNRFLFYFAYFNKKYRTFLWNLNWINLYIQLSFVIIWTNYVFCCDFYFFFGLI